MRILVVLIALSVLIHCAVCLSGLQIRGNKIYDVGGRHILLHGVDKSGTEFECVQGNGIFNGPNDQASISAMLTWKINAVRIPLNEDCWLGINGVKSEYAGQNYINAIVDFVNLLNKNNIYVILDLHWTAPGTTLATKQVPMPDMDHSPDFWKDVAHTFLDNQAVIFDLFNEPFPDNDVFDDTAAWQCWATGKNCAGIDYGVAGMQALVDAVRSTGSKNIVMLGGLAYSNSMTQWMTYVPNDPIHQTACSWHSYNFNECNNQGCWDKYVLPVAERYPIITGEIGENDCQSGYIHSLMIYADQHNISYLGWTWNNWNCDSGPALITDYTGNPTEYGLGLRTHLREL